MKFVVGSDHAGYEEKEKVKNYLRQKGFEVRDVGTDSPETCDYPDFAHRAVEYLQAAEEARGILVCGSGVGMAITANRHRGIRAGRCLTPEAASLARTHNNINCLTFGGREISSKQAKKVVDAFIETDFDGGRHSRRINKIDNPPLKVIHHPLVQTKLTQLRDKATTKKEFRELIGELTGLMFYEATGSCPTDREVVETPLAEARGKELLQRILLVPILRAGLGMVDPILELVPTAKVGHVGLYRQEETLEPVEYYLKVPENLDNCIVLLLDPMLATGGTAVKAISLLKEKGFTSDIRFLCLVAAPAGVKAVREAHPDVSIYTASVDEKLNDDGYIIPGLGDAGDRLFGTV